MNQIQFKDINLGGISDSMYQGAKGSVQELVGFDIHSEPGILKSNQAMTKESVSVVDDLVKCILPCSDGYTYLFGSTNGKIWKRSTAGAYSLQATASPAAGDAGILCAREYQGYIYYATESRLGRVAVGSPTDWSGKDDDWATFTNTDDKFHPMQKVNQVLYIGDAHYVAQVDAGVFADEALDLKTGLRIKSLGKYNTDLLIGTFVNDYVSQTEILRWNTWSQSYTISDDVPELGVNCFLKTDNFVLANAGVRGNFYLYDGSQLDNFKRLPGSWSIGNEAIIYPEARVNYFGLPLFGVSDSSSDPVKEGIWSLGGYDSNYNRVFNFENAISTGNTTDVEIGAMAMVGMFLLVAWKDTTTGSAVYGVDKLDTTQKTSTAYFITRAISMTRFEEKVISGNVNYRSLPDDSEIKIYYEINHSGSWVEADTVIDTDRKVIRIEKKFPAATVLRVKVESCAATGSNKNNAPEIESLDLIFY